MYNGVTEAYKSKLAEPSRTFRARLINTANSGEVISDGFFSVKSYGQSNEDNETLSLGGTVSTYIEVEIYQPAYMVTGKEYEYQIGLLIDDNTVEYVPVGKFTAQKPTEDDGKVTFTAYDRFVSKLGYLFTSELTYPVDGKTILNEIQTKSGVPIANISSLPDGVMIPKRTSVSEADEDGNTTTTYVNPFDGFTYRETIGYLALMYGKFATINRNGAVELRWYTDNGYQVEDNMSYNDITCAETAFEVKYVLCTIGDDSDNVLTSGSGATGISANAPVMTQALLDSIYAKVGGMLYTPTTLSFKGDPRLDLGDIITVVKRDGTEVKVPVMTLNFDYDGGLTNEVGSYGDTEQSSQANDAGPTTKRMDRVYSDLLLVKELVATKASIAYLQANYANITELDAATARIDTLESNQITVSYLQANYATIQNLNAVSGYIETLQGDFASFKTGEFTNLKSTVGDISTLIFGSASGGSITTDFSNSVVAQIGVGQIKDAMIQTLSVAKILAGDISTNKFRIVSDTGNMLLQDNTMLIKDSAGTARVQIGKDASDDYNMYLWDATGKLMFDAAGLTASGIQRAIIRNDMVSDNAAIDAKKLDIASLFTQINGSVQTITASKIKLDTEAQTLDVAFTSMSSDLDALSGTVSSQGTAISVVQGQINSKIWQQDIDTASDTMNTKYTQLSQTVSGLSSTVSSVSSVANSANTTATTAQTAINSLSIGGRNLYLGTKTFTGTAWWNLTSWTKGTDYNGFSTYYKSGQWGGLFQEKTVALGEEYTFSAYVKNGTVGNVTFFSSGGTGITTKSGTVLLTSQADWTRISVTFTITTAGTVRLRFENGLSGGDLYICGMKLEKGNKVTDWTPALEDVDASIATKVDTTTFTQLSDKFGWIVTSGTSQATMTLSSQLYSLVAQNIDLTGRVTFSSLDTSAQSRITTVESAATTANTNASSAITTANSASTNATTALSTANSALTLVSIQDTRSTNQAPSWYISNYPKKTVREFKTSSVIGLTDSTYCTLETYVPWSDTSAGYPTQIAYMGSVNKVYKRVGTSTSAWGAWFTVDGVVNTWCYTGTTEINGANIHTGTITADKINVTDLYALNATIGGFSIDANSFYKGTDAIGKANGVYLGDDGISVSDTFVAKKDGSILMKDLSSNFYLTMQGDGIVVRNSNDATDQVMALDKNNLTFYYGSASKYGEVSLSLSTWEASSTAASLLLKANRSYLYFMSPTNSATISFADSYTLDIHAPNVAIGYTNTSYALSAASFICSSWVRTVGATGWYNETYGGGWYMADSTWIRNWGAKGVFMESGNGVWVHNTDLHLSPENGLKCDYTGTWMLRVYSGGSYQYSTALGNSSYATVLYTNGNVWKNGSTTTYFATTSTSDMRLKEYVSDMRMYEGVFMDLQAIAFKYHDGLYNAPGKTPLIQWGFSAQRTIQAFKNHGIDWNEQELVVMEDGELSAEEQKYVNGDMLKMNYQNLIALDTHMIQTTILRVDDQEWRLKEVQNQLYSLQFAFARLQLDYEQLQQKYEELKQAVA